MDSGVVSLDPDGGRRDSVVTSVPSAQPGTGNQSSANRASYQPDTPTGTAEGPRNIPRQITDNASATEPKRQRSKLERPSHLDDARPAQRQRTIRDEIEFDDTDWNYEPPQTNSAWKLLIPALGLAAVVGASVIYVNFPELISNLGKKGSNLTAEQQLDLADEEFSASNFIFPAGESAADYYQLVLQDDPDNSAAQAGIRAIEAKVREQIANNMQENNLSEANRLLAGADKAGLTGLYNSSGDTGITDATQPETTTASTSPVVTPEDAVVTPVNTASIEPSQWY